MPEMTAVRDITHLGGVEWFRAPVPPRKHDCWAQSAGVDVFGLPIVERCACGAIRFCDDPYREDPWIERNQRESPPDEFQEFHDAVSTSGWGMIRTLRIDRLTAWLSARLTR